MPEVNAVEKNNILEKKFIWVPALLILGLVFVSIKNILSDFDVDSQYALAMGYRLARGERMITQMWEPHQTSAFLCAFFIKIYLGLFDTTTGIVLYLHVIGVLLKAVFTFLLYQTLKKELNAAQIFFICAYFFAVFPKGLPMPEFSNMMIWFSVGLFCSLIAFFRKQDKSVLLLTVAVFLCLLILAYPSGIIVYAGVTLLLFLYTERKWRNTLIVTGICAGIGGGYLAYILSYTGIQRFIENGAYILMGDASHSETLLMKMAGYLRDLGELVWLLIPAMVLAFLGTGIGFLICRMLKRNFSAEGKKKCWSIVFWVAALCYYCLHTLLVIDRYGHLLICIPIIFMALRCRKFCSEGERRIVTTGLIISLLCMVSSLLLSNLPLTASMSYLSLAICVSMVPITKCADRYFPRRSKFVRYLLIWAFCFLTVFRSGYIFKPMNEYVESIWILRGNLSRTVADGPAKGIVSEYMGVTVINTAMQEWKEYVKPGDRILLVSQNAVSTLGYLYEDTVISVDSTISTPTYSDKLLEYWKQNPEKYPNVVIIDNLDGVLRVNEDSWIMQWIREEFRPSTYVNGQHWRYYRAE